MKALHAIAATTALASVLASAGAGEAVRVPASAHNLLVDAKASGNLESYRKGLRGRADHVVYDPRRRGFVAASQWHEYGVAFGQDLGVVTEAQPAFWMAQWPRAVQANLIVLSGVYPNQPQPNTCWKIELRRDGKWVTHARGKGGWYNAGRYAWGGPEAEPIAFDAVRVSVFGPDDRTPIKSIHFRGEEGLSWLVARVAPIDAEIRLPEEPVRAGQAAAFAAQALPGSKTIRTWKWALPGGRTAEGPQATCTFDEPGEYEVAVTFSDGEHTATARRTVTVLPPVEARMQPLAAAVMAGRPVELSAGASVGKVKTCTWDFGDGQTAQGDKPAHTYAKPGVYKVTLTVSDGRFSDSRLAGIVRVHTPETLHVPQVVLDTDQKNEQDDQHYFAYGLFSELDVLGVNSIHHGGGQEAINYQEILHVLSLARQSGLAAGRVPPVFRGADKRLDVPTTGRWQDTQPVQTAAADAIVAAARGAAPATGVWVVPVGPGTNTASAILLARRQGLDLRGRLRVMWLGGSSQAISGEFNGNNDPWSMYVVAQSGLETWIMPAPVGARVRIDKRTEGDLYADHPLGRYLHQIVPASDKPLFDPSCLSAIVAMRLGLGWVKESEPVTVAGPDKGYRWTKTDEPTSVRVIRQIDQAAMKRDIFETIKLKPRRLVGAPWEKPQ